MKKAFTLLGGLGLGAGLMYLFDPDKGRGRRARIHDKTVHTFHLMEDVVEKNLHNMDNRMTGLAAETKACMIKEEVQDETLEQRVRAKMGHVIAHPQKVQVLAQDGHITLFGEVPEEEVKRLLQTVAAVHGVKGVLNHLGILNQKEIQYNPMQNLRMPITIAAIGAAGGLMTYFGWRHRCEDEEEKRIQEMDNTIPSDVECFG